MKTPFIASVVLFLQCFSTLGMAQALDLLYNRHDAYHAMAETGKMEGLLVNPVEQAMRDAGVTFQWLEVPVGRQRLILTTGQQAACVVGALKTPERELIGRFTLPFYQALPIVALGLADNALLISDRRLAETLENPKLTLLAKSGYTFGSFVTDSIREAGPKTLTTSAEIPNMVKMLSHRRADYFFAAEDAIAPMLRKLEFQPELFKITRFSDMPPGNLRYLWCTHKVPERTIKALNDAFKRRHKVANFR